MDTNQDHGLLSRKFIVVILGMCFVLAGAMLCHWLPAMTGLFVTYAGVISGLVITYLTGNVISKNVQLKAGVTVSSEVSAEDKK